jgi:hypothetical protein
MSVDGISNTFYPITLSGLTLSDSLNTSYIPYSGATLPANLNNQDITNIKTLGATTLNVSGSASVGTSYPLYAYNVSTIVPTSAYIILDGANQTPFSVGDTITIIGASIPAINRNYVVQVNYAGVQFLVVNNAGLPSGNYYPTGGIVYVAGTGALSSISATTITSTVSGNETVGGTLTSTGLVTANAGLSVGNGTNNMTITGTSTLATIQYRGDQLVINNPAGTNYLLFTTNNGIICYTKLVVQGDFLLTGITNAFVYTDGTGKAIGVQGIFAVGTTASASPNICLAGGGAFQVSNTSNTLSYFAVTSSNITANIDIYVPTIVYTGAYGTNYIKQGNQDAYSPYSLNNNLLIKSWWGIAFPSYDNTVRINMDTRTGNMDIIGRIKSNGFVLNGATTSTTEAGTIGTNSSYGMYLKGYQAGSIAAFSFQNYAGNNLLQLNDNGNVGIGVNVPFNNFSFLTAYKGLDIQGANGFDGATILRLYNPASQYGRTQLIMVGRNEAGNDGWSLANGRNNIIFAYQTSLNGTVYNTNAIQMYGGNLGFFCSGVSTTSPVFYLHADGRMISQAGENSKCLYGPNGYGAYLLVGAGSGGQETSSNTACVKVTNGNLHMDSAVGYGMYLNYYSQGCEIGLFGRMYNTYSNNQFGGSCTNNQPVAASFRQNSIGNWIGSRHDSTYAGSTPDCIVIGSLSNQAWIGGHNWNLTTWATMYLANGVITPISDERLKENIITANNELCYENIKKIRLVRYNYKEDGIAKDLGKDDKNRLGVLAQELREIYPRSVIERDDPTTNTSFLSINTDQLYYSLLGCTQELQNKVEQQQLLIEQQQKQIEDQQKQIDELKELVNALLKK